MKNEIGIGIVDVFTEDDLLKCKESIPKDLQSQIVTVSNKKRNITDNLNYTKQVPYAFLRNVLLHQLRIQNFKYYFLLDSNVQILNPEIFEHAIRLAETFGTWFITGQHKSKPITLEDDTNNISLDLSPHLNTNFLFLRSGIIKNFGFFDERFYNTSNLDVLDYINKLREKNVYPPKHYNPTIGTDFYAESDSKIEKINHREIPQTASEYTPDKDRSLELSVAYFYQKYKYVPSQNDPVGATQEEILTFMQKLQEEYGKR